MVQTQRVPPIRRVAKPPDGDTEAQRALAQRFIDVSQVRFPTESWRLTDAQRSRFYMMVALDLLVREGEVTQESLIRAIDSQGALIEEQLIIATLSVLSYMLYRHIHNL